MYRIGEACFRKASAFRLLPGKLEFILQVEGGPGFAEKGRGLGEVRVVVPGDTDSIPVEAVPDRGDNIRYIGYIFRRFFPLDVTRADSVKQFRHVGPDFLKTPVSKDVGKTLARMKETLRKVPNGGIGYRLLCEGDREQYMPKIYVNYQGEFEDKLDVEIEMPPADGIFQYDMELIGHVYNRRFAFTFMSKLSADAAAGIIRGFQDSLKAVVEYNLRGV